MPPHTRNSRHNSPRRKDGDDIASTSDDTLKDMMTKLMGKVAGMRGDLTTMQTNLNTMQGGFTMFHENISLIRDRVRHNHSIAPSDRERHDRSDYKSRYHDDGLDKGSRRERAPKFHGESHSRWRRDHDCHKVHEWLLGEEVSSNARMSSSPRHGGGDTSRRSIPPKKSKVSSWLSSNFPSSRSLIQSKCDVVNHNVNERVKYRVNFVANDDEEQCEHENESTAIHEEDAHPTFNDGVSSIVEAEDEGGPLNALHILNTKPKLHEVANGNKHLRENREKEEKLERENMLQKPIECEKRQKCETQKPRESGGGECESKLLREKNHKHVRKKGCLLDSKITHGRALNHHILFALGEKSDTYFTNSFDLSFIFDDFVMQKLKGLECEPRVEEAPSNFLPVMNSCEQG